MAAHNAYIHKRRSKRTRSPASSVASIDPDGMLKAWNRRVRMTSATINAVAIVRMVSANPPYRRFSSLDTVVDREGSGTTRLPLPWTNSHHILPSRRRPLNAGDRAWFQEGYRACPFPQPKSDSSDFGQLSNCPNSGKPEFGWERAQ